MKLKKSFWVKLLISSLLFSSISCTSVPVPYQNETKVNNIYMEYMNIGDIYFSLEKYDNAAENYKIAMQNKELYWAVYYKLAKCYVYQNKWNEALSMYKKILKKDTENSTIKANIAYIYLMQGNFSKAEAIYDILLSEQPDNKSYLENYLAMLLANEENIFNNLDKYNLKFDYYKEKYPDDQNISKFQKKYDDLTKKLNKETVTPSANANEDTVYSNEELFGEDSDDEIISDENIKSE